MKMPLSITLVIYGSLILLSPILANLFMTIEFVDALSKMKDADIPLRLKYDSLETYRTICAWVAVVMILFGTIGPFLSFIVTNKPRQSFEADVTSKK